MKSIIQWVCLMNLKGRFSAEVDADNAKARFNDGVLEVTLQKVERAKRRGIEQVLFGAYAGTEVTVSGEKLLVMKEEEITAIIED